MSDPRRPKRADIARMILRLARNLNENGRVYDVHRGAIDWTTYNWPKRFAFSLRLAQNLPWDDKTGGRISEARITVATQIPEDEDARNKFDDALLDDMEEDVFVVMNALDKAKLNDTNDTLVMSIEYAGSFEFSDATYKVQGYTLAFELIF